jgi:predicted small secreted protein
MKKLVLIACAAVVFLAGCNTVKGAGQDISRGGQAVSNTATEVQQNM